MKTEDLKFIITKMKSYERIIICNIFNFLKTFTFFMSKFTHKKINILNTHNPVI